MRLVRTIPVLRIFDPIKAREFYVDFLGFESDWQHRFEPELPLYEQVSRGDVVLHLSEHHGDACPGSCIRVIVDDIDLLHAELTARAYRYARPGIRTQPWAREIAVHDPFGNKIVFATPPPDPPSTGA